MNCKAIDPFVTPYVDGEIAEADRCTVEAHLLRCPPCYSRVAAERVVHELMRERADALAPPPASEALRAKCGEIARVTSRPTGDGRPVTGGRARLVPFALAASLVVGVGGTFVYQATARSTRVMAAELAADHMRCFAMNAVLGTHQDAPAVESTMASSFGWRTHVPEDHAGGDLELVGARPCLYGQGKVAHIMYTHQGRPVSLFMLPDTSRARELVDVLGHEAAIWCVGSRTFVLVAKEPKPEVERLASLVQAGLH